jgi:hypothetical protein
MGKFIEPELTFGFLAACLPVLLAFIKHITSGSLRLSKTQTVPSHEGNADGRPKAEAGGIMKVVKTEIEFSQVDVSDARASEAFVREKWEPGGSAWRRESWAEEVEANRGSKVDPLRVWC